MVSISKVLRYDALDGFIISPLQITASKARDTLVCDAVETRAKRLFTFTIKMQLTLRIKTFALCRTTRHPPPQGHALAQHGYHPAPSYPHQQPSTIAGPSNAYYPIATFPQGQYTPVQTESSESSNMAPTSFALDETAYTRPRKRKTRQTSDDLSSSVAPSMRKRRRPNAADDYRPGKFSPYTLANTSVTIMTMAVHDPKPVDTSSRGTHDPNGNSLRMRRFGVMELDPMHPETFLTTTCHSWPAYVHAIGPTSRVVCS
ncbi:hypothetical protein EV424DRAFT_1583901 [Suillus variegatus]|nr:hypothetical protein EV424DRAFT_1583901 [Suillus variegatus]